MICASCMETNHLSWKYMCVCLPPDTFPWQTPTRDNLKTSGLFSEIIKHASFLMQAWQFMAHVSRLMAQAHGSWLVTEKGMRALPRTGPNQEGALVRPRTMSVSHDPWPTKHPESSINHPKRTSGKCMHNNHQILIAQLVFNSQGSRINYLLTS